MGTWIPFALREVDSSFADVALVVSITFLFRSDVGYVLNTDF